MTVVLTLWIDLPLLALAWLLDVERGGYDARRMDGGAGGAGRAGGAGVRGRTERRLRPPGEAMWVEFGNSEMFLSRLAEVYDICYCDT